MTPKEILTKHAAEYEAQIKSMELNLAQINDAQQKLIQGLLMARGSVGAINVALKDFENEPAPELSVIEGGKNGDS
jgi:hypothetical protein